MAKMKFDDLEMLLEQVRAKRRAVLLLGGAALTLSAALSSLLVVILADQVWWLSDTQRCLTFGGLALVAAVVGYVASRAAWRSWSPGLSGLAVLIEARFPKLAGLVVNTVQLPHEREHSSPSLVDHAIRLNLRSLDAVLADGKLTGAVTTRPCWTRLVAALAAAACVSLALSFGRVSARAELARILLPWMSERGPRLIVAPGDQTVLQDAETTVSLRVDPNRYTEATLRYRLKGEREHAVPLSQTESAFSYRFDGVRKAILYRFSAGPYSSDTFCLTPVGPPIVESVKVSAAGQEFPRPDVVVQSGTRLLLEANCSRELKNAVCVLTTHSGQLQSTRLRVAGDVARGSIVAKASGLYQIRIVDVHGFKNERPTVHTIGLLTSKPPTVAIVSPESGTSVSETDVVRFVVRAHSLDGLRQVWLKTQDDRPLKDWQSDAGQTELVVSTEIAAKQLGIKAGRELTVLARVQSAEGAYAQSEPCVLTGRQPRGKGRPAQSQDLGLAPLIAAQKASHKVTRDSIAQEGQGREVSVESRQDILDRQIDVRSRAQGLLRGVASGTALSALMDSLTQNEMAAAVRTMEESLDAQFRDRVEYLRKEAGLQRRILHALTHETQFQLATGALNDVQTELRSLLVRQKALLADTERTAGGAAAPADPSKRQKAIADEFGALCERKLPEGSDPCAAGFASVLRKLAASDVRENMAHAAGALRFARWGEAVPPQERAVRQLEAALAELSKARQASAGQTLAAEESAHRKADGKLEKMAKVMDGLDETLGKGEALDRETIGEAEDALRRLENVAQRVIEDLKRVPYPTIKDQAQAETVEELRKKLAQTRRDISELKAAKERTEITPQVFGQGGPKEKAEGEPDAAKQADADDPAEPGEGPGGDAPVELEKAQGEFSKPFVKATEEMLDAMKNNTERAEDGDPHCPSGSELAKWELEDFDPKDMAEIPMVEIPEKLSDLVGDMVEKQEQLNEEMDNKTSNWNFSQWGADGGINDRPGNMYGAQGKTGSTAPQDFESRGRSASGRTGRASGEMVESERKQRDGGSAAERFTDEKAQEGGVKDDTDSPSGGTSRGGKGTEAQGDTGLRAEMTKEDLAGLKEVHAVQRYLRQHGALVEKVARHMRLPSHALTRAVEQMAAAEAHLLARDIRKAQAAQATAVEYLVRARKSLVVPISTEIDASASAGRPIEEGSVLDARAGECVPAYRDLASQYFKFLSQRSKE